MTHDPLTIMQLRRSLAVTARVLSEKEGTVEYIASDATLDSYQESILSSGWRFNLFQRNSPFVDSHNYNSIESLLGKVESARIEGGQLVETVRWAKDIEENKLATLGWKMTVGGFLKAVSVGFRALKAVWPNDSGWNGYVQEAGLTPEYAGKCRRIFVEQEQLELSACILGANPAAVAKAHAEKCITDGDLAAVGFTDDDLHFLTLAGAASERPDLDPVMRALMGREMARITCRRTQSPTPSPGEPDSGERAMCRAAERTEFLRQLQALTR
jgi:hypothetical protein